MMLMACDQSVRGFAVACAPTFWGGDWSKVVTARTDGGKVKRGDDKGRRPRMERLFRWVDGQLAEHNPNVVGFESYAYGSGADYDVVELVGAIKLHCWRWQKETETIQQSSARKLIAGPHVKIPRKGAEAKATMRNILVAHGCSPLLSLDETDALVVLNAMLITHGGRPLVENP